MHVKNPFYKRSLEESDPALWSSDDIEGLVTPTLYSSTRGRVPVLTDRLIIEHILDKLQTISRDPSYNEGDMWSKTFDLIDYSMTYIGKDRQILGINSGYDRVEINGGDFGVPFHLGCTVNGIPIFHFTDSLARYEERRQLIPDLNYVSQGDSMDGLDIAALIALAYIQKEFLVEPHTTYKTHVMYPTSTYRQLVLLTGWVLSDTITALKEGHQEFEPITLSREVFDIPFDPTCDVTKTAFFQIIAGLVDEGAAISARKLRKSS